jgi:ATP-dependent DNA ligase
LPNTNLLPEETESPGIVRGFCFWRNRQYRLLSPPSAAVQLCAFDILVEGGDDLRKLPLHLRKTALERLLARRPDGIFVNPFERGEIGPDLFTAACRMGLEGIVSKRRDRPYQAGRSKHWLKIKNRQHPAMSRGEEWVRASKGV